MDRGQSSSQKEGWGAKAKGEGCDASEKRDLAIPLCLPDNWKWYPQRQECVKVAETRSKLCENKEALEQLSQIEGPVCVVSIAGDYRTGKSFVLSKAFNQPNVFPLGHTMRPETVGIWLWIVPEKYKDVEGREFTVVLLDSEGIDSAFSEGFHDHQIFTLVVLLANVLVYNSQNVVKRKDLEGLDFIANLSKRIKIRSESKTGANKQLNEKELYHKTFPYFIWLLRDSLLEIPDDYEDLTDFLLKEVLVKADLPVSSRSDGQVAESIIRLFSGFKAFRLPMPAKDVETLKHMYDDDSNVHKEFLKGLDDFKLLLEPILAPKKSFYDGEFVTGEGLAALVTHYIEAINSPDAIPNVQSVWDTIVKDIFHKAKKSALTIYEALLKAQLSGCLPGDNDWIRRCHNSALEQSQKKFMEHANGLSTRRVQRYLRELKVSIDEKLTSWLNENRKITRELCKQLLGQLKQRHLNPLLEKLRDKELAKQVSYADVNEGYDQIEKDYKKSARGAKDTIAEVYSEFHPGLWKERDQYLSFLRQLKDYEVEKEKERAARAIVESTNLRLEEKNASLQQQNIEQKKQMDLLIQKTEEEIKRIEANLKEEAKKQKALLESMVSAKMEKAEKERKKFMKENKKLQEKKIELQNVDGTYKRKMKALTDKVQAREEDAKEHRRRLDDLQAEVKTKSDEVEMVKSKALSDKAIKDKEISDLRSEIKDLKDQKASFIADDPPDDDCESELPDPYDDVIDDIETTNDAQLKAKEPGFFDFVKGLFPVAAGVVASIAAPAFAPILGPAAAGITAAFSWLFR